MDNNCWNSNLGVDASFRGRNVLRVKVNIEMGLFKGDLDPKALDVWLRKIESYFVVDQFSSQEKVAFATLNFSTNALSWWEYFKEIMRQIFNLV